MSWTERAAALNHDASLLGQARAPRDFDAKGARGDLGGRSVVSFASNDYLGLSVHPAVIEAGRAALEQWGAGSGSARLIVGSRPVHSELEAALAEWKDCEAALLFPNGFTANLGVLSTLGGPGTTIFSDELNHASIVDGCRLSRADVRVFPHRDVAALEGMLAHSSRSIVVSDSVFSMDGDEALVDDLAELCRRYDALLVIDEAHAVLGPDPTLTGVEHLRVGTLSKFLGSFGGFVAGKRELIELLINRSRPFIFTTASSPADAAAALAALNVFRSEEGDRLRARLRAHVDRIATGHPSPIVPVVIGEAEAALDASQRLLERGLFVPAIRPPSVRVGTSRLRVTVSAAHTDDEISALANNLSALKLEEARG
ncbi:MAG: 8-amino-7-oxononanoate synthase [Actinomycetota bacterium]|nr:8-amino-7-oxononanoate synthase [Actinomycetota bacterium]